MIRVRGGLPERFMARALAKTIVTKQNKARMHLKSKIGKRVKISATAGARERGAKDRLGKIVGEVWGD